MTKLECVISEMSGKTEVKDWRAIIAAAKLDNEAAYRQGVEDGRAFSYLEIAQGHIKWARTVSGWHNDALAGDEIIRSMLRFKQATERAFHGARGISRVEIRQRLERMKVTDNG